MIHRTPQRLKQVALAAILMTAPSVTAAQGSRSAALATELVRLLDQMKLDSVAARQGPDQFVGALYFPGSQLLVVSGRFTAPERAGLLLGQKAYRDIYIDLNSASVPQSKIFISDLGANGLSVARDSNQPMDTVERDGRRYTFDGDWAKAKMSQDEYRRVYSLTDDQYAAMLQALLAQLQKPS